MDIRDLRDVKEFIKDISKYILIFILVLILVLYVISFQQTVGPSMKPTYNDQDVAFLSKIHYKLFDVKRFDIISLKYNDTKFLIKRVIGLPGDTVEYKENKLYINGKHIEESFIKNVKTEDFDFNNICEVKNSDCKTGIPDDMYLVLGDNRKNSMDSRKIGLISKKDIVGKVLFRVWPIFN